MLPNETKECCSEETDCCSEETECCSEEQTKTEASTTVKAEKKDESDKGPCCGCCG